jgi:hypothetical protein
MNILNKFKREIYAMKDIDKINNLCLKEPPKDSTIYFHFNTNK